MSPENVELHRRTGEAFNSRDIDAWLVFCHPEVELHSAVTVPGGALYHGHAGVRRWHRDLEEAFGDQVHIEPEALFDLGEHTVSIHLCVDGGGAAAPRWRCPPRMCIGGAMA